jgi:TIR domain
MSGRAVKCDCGAIVSAEGIKELDAVTCQSCGKPVRVTPRRLEDARRAATTPPPPKVAASPEPTYSVSDADDFDVFLSHATEDKEGFAKPLADALRQRGLRVWFDQSTLTIGDSIRRSIDRALAQSHFAVVLLSPSFISKEWPNRELDGLFARTDGRLTILPVLHGISDSELKKYSPTLADRVSISTDQGVGFVADHIYHAVKYGSRPALVAVSEPQSPLDAIQRAILLAPSRGDLTRCFYEVEEYLSHHPMDVKARTLKDAINLAIAYESRRGPVSLGRRPEKSVQPQTWLHRAVSCGCLMILLPMVAAIALLIFFRLPDVPIAARVRVAASPLGDHLSVSKAPNRDLKFVLTWQTVEDLDLSVIDPSGVQIAYWNPDTNIGKLDHDVRPGPGQETISVSKPQAGRYQVIVSDVSQTTSPEFELAVVVGGETHKVYVGKLERGRDTYKLDVDLNR